MRIPKSSSGEMPFLDHLEELRWRIVYSLGALMIGVAIGFFVVLKLDFLLVIQEPIRQYLPSGKLGILHPGDSCSILMKMALIIGIIVAIPVVGYQIWAFMSPALHKHERRIIVPILAVATLLFCGGVALAYFLVLPMTLKFLMALGSEAFTNQIVASEYFSFVTSMCLAFGLVFEVPIVLVGLSAFGIVSPMAMGKLRKYAIVICWIVAAVITPGDLFTTTIMLAIPLYLLYEVSVAVSWVIYRRKARRRAAEELADQSGATA